MPRFDHIVLTAANESQARGYRTQIDWRVRCGMLDADTHYHVVPDPNGRRVGSLGATLCALRSLAQVMTGGTEKVRRLADLFVAQRVLICHSGGDSRRLPAYAAQGKVFTPLPTTHHGRPAALFDLLLANVQELPAPERGQVLVYVGDVLLTFDSAAVRFDTAGVVGVAYPGSIDTGSRHGVYVVDAAQAQTGFAPVRDFLQKPDEDTARRRHGIDPVGRVLIDTGILSLDPSTTATLLDAAGVKLHGGRVLTGPGLLADLEAGQSPGLDLYKELLFAISPKITAAHYSRLVGGMADAAHRKRIDGLYRAVRGAKFHVNVLPDCDFFHVGSSREFLANIATLNRTADAYGFADMHAAVARAGTGLEGTFVYNTIVQHRRVRAAAGTLIEACDIDVAVVLPGRNLLVGLPSGGKTQIRLRSGSGLVCLPIGDRHWAAVCYGVDDDFKGAMDGAAGCGFLNEPIDKWLVRHHADASAIWSRGAARTLWEAKLWTVGRLDRVLADAMWIQGARRQPERVARWQRARRMSIRELVARVNHRRLIEHRQGIQRRVELARLGERLLTDDELSAAAVTGQICSSDEAVVALEQVVAACARSDSPLFAARAMKLSQMIVADHHVPAATRKRLGLGDAAALEHRAFTHVADSVSQSVSLPRKPRPSGILHDQVVWVTTPVRLDFCGGWSDTPPFCTEHGGTVINAAIRLNGQYPVQAMAKLNTDGVIRLSSIDLGRTQTITTTEQLLAYTDPGDWAALPKATMVLAGVGPSEANQALKKWLDRVGGGIDLTIFSALPKGSGLGTSSILGATVLACLGRMLGVPSTHDELIARTSVLEQMMTTGGGWQDQVGGILPGVKLIQTKPGPDQTPTLRWIAFDATGGTELRQRMLLYYTGQKRMAKNILQNVVGRYLARDPLALRTIAELKDAALEMKEHLDRRDYDAFGRGVDRYWTLKKQLDPGATNPAIEQIITGIDRWCAGKTLPGAGGGGFIFMVAHDADAAAKIRRHLDRQRPNGLARFFEFDIDQTGLNVTTL